MVLLVINLIVSSQDTVFQSYLGSLLSSPSPFSVIMLFICNVIKFICYIFVSYFGFHPIFCLVFIICLFWGNIKGRVPFQKA